MSVSLVALVAACVQVVPLPLLRLSPQQSQNQAGSRTLGTSQIELSSVATPTEVPAQVAALNSTRGQTRPTPTPVPTLAPKQLAPAHIGSIVEKLQLNGRVTAVQEAPLAFSMRGTIDAVTVDPGQAVQAGQVLVTLDSSDAAKQLKDAQAERQINLVRLQQLQSSIGAQAATRRQQAADREQQAALREQRIADATAQAQEQLRRAQVNYDNVKAGATAAERLAAQAGVVTAQGSLGRAQADLARLNASPTPAELSAAEQAVTTAQIALKRAQTERDTLVKPPDPATIAAARKDVADAQAGVVRATNPSTGSAPGAPRVSAAEREQVQAAAQFALTAAQAHLADLLKGPDKAAVDLANMSVDSAKAELANAQAHLQLVKAGPTLDQKEAAKNAVDVAALGLQGAKARLEEVNGHPTAEELRLAQQQIDAAQTALEAAARPPQDDSSAASAIGASGGAQDSGSGVIEQMQLQHTLDQQQSQIQTLQVQIEASQIRAPFNGTVQSLQVRPGDAVDARRPVLVLASDGAPIIQADVSELDAARLSVGMTADVQVDSSTTVAGSIAALGESRTGSGRQVQIQVPWSLSVPTVGASLPVEVTLSRRGGVLLINQRAVRNSTGDRHTVELLDGSTRRTVDVTVGARSGDEIEVLGGLVDGQVAVLPS